MARIFHGRFNGVFLRVKAYAKGKIFENARDNFHFYITLHPNEGENSRYLVKNMFAWWREELSQLPKVRCLRILSWILDRIIKLVVYYETPSVFNIITKKWENIVYFKSSKRSFEARLRSWKSYSSHSRSLKNRTMIILSFGRITWVIEVTSLILKVTWWLWLVINVVSWIDKDVWDRRRDDSYRRWMDPWV